MPFNRRSFFKRTLGSVVAAALPKISWKKVEEIQSQPGEPSRDKQAPIAPRKSDWELFINGGPIDAQSIEVTEERELPSFTHLTSAAGFTEFLPNQKRQYMDIACAFDPALDALFHLGTPVWVQMRNSREQVFYEFSAWIANVITTTSDKTASAMNLRVELTGKVTQNSMIPEEEAEV